MDSAASRSNIALARTMDASSASEEAPLLSIKPSFDEGSATRARASYTCSSEAIMGSDSADPPAFHETLSEDAALEQIGYTPGKCVHSRAVLPSLLFPALSCCYMLERGLIDTNTLFSLVADCRTQTELQPFGYDRLLLLRCYLLDGAGRRVSPRFPVRRATRHGLGMDRHLRCFPCCCILHGRTRFCVPDSWRTVFVGSAPSAEVRSQRFIVCHRLVLVDR